jgi:hypothetical protein
MRNIRIGIDKFINFRKKHYTYFLLVEELLLLGVITSLMFLTKVTKQIATPSGNEVVSSIYHFQLFKENLIACVLPSISSLIVVLFTFIIFIIKDVFKKPIPAKKLTKPLFIVSVIVFFVTVGIMYTYNYYYVSSSGGVSYIYNHRLSFIVTAICQVLMLVDIWFWRSEFNLEKLYGSNDPVY